MNKRGVSQVITTILLIAIVIVAVAVIGGIIMAILGDADDSTSDIAIITARAEVEGGKVYFDSSKILQLSLTRGSDQAEIPYFRVTISGNDVSGDFHSLSFDVSDPPIPQGTKTYAFNIAPIVDNTEVDATPMSKSGKSGIKDRFTGGARAEEPPGGWLTSVEQPCTLEYSCVVIECTDGKAKEKCSKCGGDAEIKDTGAPCLSDDYVSWWKFDDDGLKAGDETGRNDGDVYVPALGSNIVVLAIGDWYSGCSLGDYATHYYNPESGVDLVPASHEGIDLYDYDVIVWRGDHELNPSVEDVNQLKEFLRSGGGIYVQSAGLYRDGIDGEEFFPGSAYEGSCGVHHILEENHYVSKGYSGDYGDPVASCSGICWSAGYGDLKPIGIGIAREFGPSGCSIEDDTYTIILGEWEGGRVYWSTGCNVDETMTHRAYAWLTGRFNSVSGLDGNALEFDSVNDYVEIGDADLLKKASKTISLWAKPDAITGHDILFSSGGANYYVSFNGDNMRVSYENSIGVQVSQSTPVTINAGEWHLYTWVFEVSGSDVNIGYYKDGSSLAPTSFSGGYSPNYGSNFIIGNFQPSSSYSFNGSLDNVMVYDRALSGSEVSAIYDLQK